jgi:hypothetical protein
VEEADQEENLMLNLTLIGSSLLRTKNWFTENPGTDPDEEIGALFHLSVKDANRASLWMNLQVKKHPKEYFLGERFSYSFIPSSIGCTIILRDLALKEEIELTDDAND